MYRPGIKYRNIMFEFNVHDDDDHPSVPHGDSIGDHHFHLDLRNGAVWEKRDRIIGYLDKKEFERLKSDKKMHELIINAQAYYNEHHPSIRYEPIPWCDNIIIYNKVNYKPRSRLLRIFRIRLNVTQNNI